MKQEETHTRQEKELLGEYFETMVKHLPGGLVVIRYENDGKLTPEFLSEGFAAMTDMTWEDAWTLYRQNALNGAHPDDLPGIIAALKEFLSSGQSQWELSYRLLKGDGTYMWIKNALTIVENEKGERRIYANYHDITKEQKEQEQLRRQYNELILKHYLAPGRNELLAGHCNITGNQIVEAIDYSNSHLLDTFSDKRDEFFTALSNLIVDPKDRQSFQDTFLNEPTLKSYENGETEIIRDFYLKFPDEAQGRYAQFKVKLITAPDTGDITGILNVTDITEKVISDLMMQQLSVASYDLVADVDLLRDHFVILTEKTENEHIQGAHGCYSERVNFLIHEQVLPKDKAHIERMLDPNYMMERLKQEGAYSFPYSIRGTHGEFLTKNMTVSAVDLRLGRICLSRTDITASLREQQRLFSVIAYTFEILAFIDVSTGHLTFHTRQTILENLPPFIVDDYDLAIMHFTEHFDPERHRDEVQEKFRQIGRAHV